MTGLLNEIYKDNILFKETALILVFKLKELGFDVSLYVASEKERLGLKENNIDLMKRIRAAI